MYFQNSFIIGIINFNDVMVEFDALNGCKEIRIQQNRDGKLPLSTLYLNMQGRALLLTRLRLEPEPNQ